MTKKLIVLFSLLFLSGCSLIPPSTESNLNLNQIPTASPTSVLLSVSPTPKISPKTMANINPMVALNTKDGQIVIKLYRDITPNTVANFLKKTESGFYDGLIFHRVIPGFMAQGGDPTGTGTGGGQIKSELNNVPFKRGSLGLARTPATNQISNDSQFFICFTDTGCSHLTGDYVNFGEIVSGFDVLDKIQQGDKIVSLTDTTK